MAYEILAAVSLVGLYIVFVIVKWVLHRRHVHTIFQRYNIPGPKPNFLDGNMNELKAAPTPNDVISRWLKEYGPVFGYFIGEMPYMVVKDLDMLKHVMIKDFQNFRDRADMFLHAKPLCDTVIALGGQRWKDVRTVLTPTFSSMKIKLMSRIMNEKVETTLEMIDQFSTTGEMFDIYQVVQGLTLDVIADCALAMKTNCQRDLKDPLLVGAQNFFRYAHNKAVDFAIMFPFVATILSFIARYFTAGQMTTMIVNNVTEQIRHRRQNPQIQRLDLLQLMFESADSKTKDGTSKKHVQLTDDELVANAYVFLLAGYETTGTALALTFWQLIQHPDIQERLYQEVIDVCTEDELSYDTVQSMEYLDQVFNESMRILPPVTLFVSRKCENECTVGDYTIPKGVIVQAPVWDIQHDPDLWPDPWVFDPDRFSKENKSQIHNLSFFPFGIGPRNCIGMRFAQLEAKMAIAKLLRKYKFVSCEKTENPLTFICPTVIINPANGVFLRAVERNTL